MIAKAKVNLAAVKAFDKAAMEARGYSSKFDKGISCLEQLHSNLEGLEKELQDKTSAMQAVHEKLTMKIKEIEKAVTKLTVQLNGLRNQLSGLESELSGTIPHIVKKTEEGKKYKVENPAYAALKVKISAIEGEINMVEAELYAQQQRLERADTVKARLSLHIDAVNSAIYSLGEKKNSCRQLKGELGNVKKSNIQKSTSAVESLKKIEQIVARYMSIKMCYGELETPYKSIYSQDTHEININVNVSRTTVVNESETVQDTEMGQNVSESEDIEDAQIKDEDTDRDTVVNESDTIQDTEMEQEVSEEEEIEKPQIKYDEDGHICEYEGRKYGGKYNSYEVRINGTLKDDSLYGKYMGDRGESKFIPSKKLEEGKKIIKILSEYGLDGIEYRNGEPDFEVCSEGIVVIKTMTENRENYYDRNEIYHLGNFSQADIELARIWSFEEKEGKKDWTAREVYDYRKSNRLSWHEKCDTETMVLVRTEINDYFKHLGGCSECRVRDAGKNGGDIFDE